MKVDNQGLIISGTSHVMVFHHGTLAGASIRISWKESKECAVCTLCANSKSPQRIWLTLKDLILPLGVFTKALHV